MQPLQRKNKANQIIMVKKGGQQRAIRNKKGKCEKGGITIMDQPINLPSQFISLRCRCVEIQIFLLGAPKSCETFNPLSRQYFPAFAASPELFPP